MNVSKKKQQDIKDILSMIIEPMDVAKEIMRKDPIAKKKFEALEAIAIDLMVYCVPEVKKEAMRFNEKQKAIKS